MQQFMLSIGQTFLHFARIFLTLKPRSSSIGYSTGSGEPAVLGLRLAWVRVRCCSSTTPPLPRTRTLRVRVLCGYRAVTSPARRQRLSHTIFMKRLRHRRPAASPGRFVIPSPMRSFSNSTACSPSTNKLVKHWLKGRGIYRIPVSTFFFPSKHATQKNPAFLCQLHSLPPLSYKRARPQAVRKDR